MELLLRIIYSSMIIGGLYFIGYYLINQEWFMRIIIKTEKAIIEKYVEIKVKYRKFIRQVVFKEDGTLYSTYSKMLMFTKFSVEGFFNVKIILAIITITICILVKTTDIYVYTDELFTKFQYEQDVIMLNLEKLTPEQTAITAEFKKKCIGEAIKMYDRQKFKSMDKNQNEEYIKQIITSLGNPTTTSTESLANEVYYKIKKYYEVREVNFSVYTMITLAVFFLPELFILLFNFFVKVDSNRELSFMKRLIIMNGSIKPVDFMEVLKELIRKSKYYKKVLEEIQDKNKKNYLPNTQIYLPYIRKSKSLTEKLFFEKLDEANNYDFDQAILNIKNEFTLDKRTQARKIKKTVEAIHIWGIVGFMGLIVFIVMYLILPWMSAYKMDNMMG